MQFNQMSDNCQPQAKSPMHTRLTAVSLAETIKDERKKSGVDALTSIAHRNFYISIQTRESHHDAAGGGGELDRIDEQVPDRLLQTAEISHDVAAPRTKRHPHVTSSGPTTPLLP